jgi:hypothetical protein
LGLFPFVQKKIETFSVSIATVSSMWIRPLINKKLINLFFSSRFFAPKFPSHCSTSYNHVCFPFLLPTWNKLALFLPHSSSLTCLMRNAMKLSSSKGIFFLLLFTYNFIFISVFFQYSSFYLSMDGNVSSFQVPISILILITKFIL